MTKVIGIIKDALFLIGGAIVVGTILATIAMGLINLPKLTRKTLSKLAGVVIGLIMAWSIITFMERLSFWCYDHGVAWVSVATVAVFIGGCIYLGRRIYNK